MRIFIDTNILLDVFLERKDFYDDSAFIWKLAENRIEEVCISAISFNNIHYIMRKNQGLECAQRAMEILNANFTTVPLTHDIIGKAIALRLLDFEDALQFFSAISVDANHLVTRNAKDFPQGILSVLSPQVFITQYTDNNQHPSE